MFPRKCRRGSKIRHLNRIGEREWIGFEYGFRIQDGGAPERQCLPATDRILPSLLDMRIPLTVSVEGCRLIGRIILDCLSRFGGRAQGPRASAAASG